MTWRPDIVPSAIWVAYSFTFLRSQN